MQTYNKEAIYDEKISPLMAQIIQIALDNGIQMLASFALMDEDPDYDNEPMLCTSKTPGDNYNNEALTNAGYLIFGQGDYTPRRTMAITITGPR